MKPTKYLVGGSHESHGDYLMDKLIQTTIKSLENRHKSLEDLKEKLEKDLKDLAK